MDSPTYHFGRFEISAVERLLRRDGEVVHLPPKALDTLLLLIQSRGQMVPKDQIIQTVWPDAVVEENNLTQQISLLRKTFSNGAGSDGWIQTIPKRGYRFTGDVSTGGGQAILPVPQVPLKLRQAGLPVFHIVVALIAVALLTIFMSRRPEQIRSVAVLPIQPLTSNEELSAVGLGVSDAVVQRLSYARSLDVRPMASVRHYLGRNADVLAVGRALNVDAVVAGTIQKHEDRFRVTMEMIDVRSNRSRWTGKIEEKASDIFRLQDIVAEATLRSLPDTTKSASAPVRRPVSPEAHEAFLKGRYYWSRRTGDDTERSIRELERAVALDNSYAAAWAALASSINVQSLHFISEPEASFSRSRAAAMQALRLDPNLAEAHAAIGFINYYYDWKWNDAEKAFRRAIALDPNNGNYRQLLSNLMMSTSRFDEGIREIQEAMRADPASIMVRSVAGRQYYLARRYDDAERTLRSTLALDSSFPAAHSSLGIALSAMGRLDEARREAEEALRRGFSAQGYTDLAVIEARAGNRDASLQWIEKAKTATKNGAAVHYDLALAYTALGDADAAFAQLDQGIAQRYSGMVWLKIDPRMDPLRSDPRFARYVKRVGFPDT